MPVKPVFSLARSLPCSIVTPHCARTVSQRPSAPWMTSELKSLKAEKRRTERRWRKTGLPDHKLVYKSLVSKMNNLITKAKKCYYETKIMAASTSKCLFNFVSEMYGKSKTCILPNNVPSSELPKLFNTFFISKISKLRSLLDAKNNPASSETVVCHNVMSEFRQLTPGEVKSIVLSSPCKSSCLDPIPTQFIFNHIDIFIECISSIVNDSLLTGVMPLCFRKAVISPLLKKPNLDPNILKNYRPVSNLPFLSKVIEKVVAAQITEHLNKNGLF